MIVGRMGCSGIVLGEVLKEAWSLLRRFKTGTPARVLRSSIDFSDLEAQCGDDPVIPFSYETENPGENRALCYIRLDE